MGPTEQIGEERIAQRLRHHPHLLGAARKDGIGRPAGAPGRGREHQGPRLPGRHGGAHARPGQAKENMGHEAPLVVRDAREGLAEALVELADG